MKKKELQDLIKRYDKEKGPKRRLFSTSSEVMIRLQAFEALEEVMEITDNERLPYSVIYQIHKLMKETKYTAASRLSGRLLQSCEPLIKNFLPSSKAQQKAFDKIQADYNILLDSVKANKEQITELEQELSSGKLNLDVTEKVKLELQNVTALLDDAWNKRENFNESMGGWVLKSTGGFMLKPPHILDQHLLLKVNSFSAKLDKLMEENRERATKIKSKLQSSLSKEDQLIAENQSLQRQNKEQREQLQLLAEVVRNLSQAYTRALTHAAQEQVTAQNYCIQRLSKIKEQYPDKISQEICATISDVIKSIHEHMLASMNMDINFNNINQMEVLAVHANVLDINFMTAQKNDIEILIIEKYKSSIDNDSTILLALQQIVDFMDHHIQQTRAHLFHEEVEKLINQEIANIKSTTKSVEQIAFSSKDLISDMALFDLSEIESKLSQLNINDQAQLNNFHDVIKAKIQSVQNKLDAKPETTMKILAEDTQRSLTRMNDAITIFNTHAKIDPKLKEREKVKAKAAM